jgi:8-oxo-dGTP pyrophosphatase MutT (NUDIX family)
MSVERSAGAIIFRKDSSSAKATESKGDKIYYLLLHYPTRTKRRVEDEGRLRAKKMNLLLTPSLALGKKRKTSSINQAKRRVEDEGKLRRRQTSSTSPKKEYWDLPKGHIEKGEDILETVKREIFEETGLKDINFKGEFKETIKYFFKWEGKNILKFVTFYLTETKTKEVKISGEHVGFQWLSYDDAMSRLTFKNAKNILQKANDYLNQKPNFHLWKRR